MQLIVTEATIDAKFNELQQLQERRDALIEDKQEAQSQGDLKENAGYHMAKEQQAVTETRIAELLQFLQANTFVRVNPNSWVKQGKPSLVDVGTVVTIERPNLRSGKPSTEVYLVAGALDSERPENSPVELEFLPYNSPLAAAIQRKGVGSIGQAHIAGRLQKITVRDLRFPTIEEISALFPSAAKAQTNATLTR